MVRAAAFTFTLWTNDPDLARRADAAGVDRIGLDLETVDKAERQGGYPTWISPHDIAQLPAVRDAISAAGLFVRCNPLYPGSREEVERLLDMGVAILMLPNFTRLREVEDFLRIVDGRAKVVPLVERVAALNIVSEFSTLCEIGEIHIGLNDLSIDLGISNRLAVLTMGLLDQTAATCARMGTCLSLGGVGRALDGSLPVPSDLVYAQYPRLGATGALISRSFQAQRLDAAEFAAEISRARARMEFWVHAGPERREAARRELARLCANPLEATSNAISIPPPS